jgi:flagellar assembly factor FliW
MGIFGFAVSKSFVIIDLESQKPFKWMQCIEDPSTAFVLSDPLLIHSSYCAVVRRAELEPLGSPADLQEQDLVVSVILTITDRPEDMSANFCAPLIFNLANRRGMQYVLNDRKYPVRYRIFQNDTTTTETPVVSVVGESRALSLR